MGYRVWTALRATRFRPFGIEPHSRLARSGFNRA